MNNGTIAAIATAAGTAGIGTVRISGKEAISTAEKVFRPLNVTRGLSRLKGYSAVLGRVFDQQGDIDDCVALVFRAPHSYTGEDVVELSCHGGSYLLRRVLRAVLEAGAQPADPGEFTRRAFFNGKMDLTRVEAVSDLIAAQGRLAARTALAARDGATARCLQEICGELLGVQAGFTAAVDYPDDDIPDPDPMQTDAVLQACLARLDGLLETYDAGRVLREGVDTVIVGSPNVGKSTLMNRLAGCERSIVTPIAGTTRDVVEETVRLGEVLLRLSDTAGLRQTEDTVEAIGVARTREKLATAALIIAVFDGSRPLNDEDRALLAQIVDQPTVAVINKADLPIAAETEEIRRLVPHTVELSAEKERDLTALTQAVEQVTGIAALDGDAPLLAGERQRRLAQQCRDSLAQARRAMAEGFPPDAVSQDIDGAIGALLELTGERVTEAVTQEVFSRFCVGK